MVDEPTKGNDLLDYSAEARAANIAVRKLGTAVDLVRETEEAIFLKYGQPVQDSPEHVLAVNNRAVIRELVIAVGELGRILGDVLSNLDSVTGRERPADAGQHEQAGARTQVATAGLTRTRAFARDATASRRAEA